MELHDLLIKSTKEGKDLASIATIIPEGYPTMSVLFR
jgi:hypothetical protein